MEISFQEAGAEGSNPVVPAIYSSDKRYGRLAGRVAALSSYGGIVI